jgi:hypothetical protein
MKDKTYDYLYINRYQDKITFTKHISPETTTEGYLVMEGYQYARYGFDKDPEDRIFIDPSGGPYISIGNNLGFISKTLIDHFVTKITYDKELKKRFTLF